MVSKSRNITVVLVISLFATLSLWATGTGEEGEAEPTPETNTLKIWHFIDPDGDSARGQALKAIMESFKETHPNVEFDTEVIQWNQLSTRFMASYDAGDMPDLSWVEIPYVPRIIEQGSAANLQPHIEEDWGPDAGSDFPSALWQVGRSEDGKYALTTYHMGHALGYRKSVFDAVGANAEDIQSWDQFMEVGERIVDLDRDMWAFGYALTRQQRDLDLVFSRLMVSQGEQTLDPQSWQANWTGQAGNQTMQLLTSLINEHEVQSQRDLTYSKEEQAVNFARGLFAVGIVGSQKYADIMSKAGERAGDIGLMRWPSFDGREEGSPIDTWGWGMVIGEKSQHKDLAWDFLAHYQSAESDMINVEIGGQLPTRLSTVENDYFDSPEAAHLRWYLDYMADSTYMLQYKAPGGHWDELILAFHDIVVNDAPIEEALNDAATTYNRSLR